MQSGANFTFMPNSFSTAATVCLIEYLSSAPFFGLPKCDIKTQLPPSFKIFLIVGMVALMRLSLVTSSVFLSSGTLKSTRMSTRFPLKFTSLIVFITSLNKMKDKNLIAERNPYSLGSPHHLRIDLHEIHFSCGFLKRDRNYLIVSERDHSSKLFFFGQFEGMNSKHSGQYAVEGGGGSAA